jgi:hypothetical protein
MSELEQKPGLGLLLLQEAKKKKEFGLFLL